MQATRWREHMTQSRPASIEKVVPTDADSVEIERPGNKLRFLIRTARPGIVIGRKGAEIEKLKTELGKRTSRDVFIDIIEVNKPELDAQLVSENIALQLEKRVSFRRAMRKSVDSALRFGCKGIKVRVSGRLNGNEIARSEWYLQGRLPLHTLRADIDYGFTEANTTYGVIGVKTWIYRGDIYEQKRRQAPAVGTISVLRQAGIRGWGSFRLTVGFEVVGWQDRCKYARDASRGRDQN